MLEDSADCEPTTDSIFPWLRFLRLGLVLSGLVAAIAHAETTPSDRSDERAAHNSVYLSVYLELGGTGLLWSANYDRMLGENFSLRAGVEMLSFYSFCDCNSVFFGIPIAASALILPGAHKLELGDTTFIGTTDSTGFTPAPVIWATGILGYRYVPKHSGFMFRATFTPLLAAGYIGTRGLGAPRPFFFPWGGLSVGYQF